MDVWVQRVLTISNVGADAARPVKVAQTRSSDGWDCSARTTTGTGRIFKPPRKLTACAFRPHLCRNHGSVLGVYLIDISQYEFGTALLARYYCTWFPRRAQVNSISVRPGPVTRADSSQVTTTPPQPEHIPLGLSTTVSLSGKWLILKRPI